MMVRCLICLATIIVCSYSIYRSISLDLIAEQVNEDQDNSKKDKGDTRLVAKAYRETLGNLRLIEPDYVKSLGLTTNQSEFLLEQFRRENLRLDDHLKRVHFISDGDRLNFIALFWRNNQNLINSLTDPQQEKHFKIIKGVE